MNNIQILANGKYLPRKQVNNEELAKQFGVTPEYIENRTGIQTRYYIEEESIEELAIRSYERFAKKNTNRYAKD